MDLSKIEIYIFITFATSYNGCVSLFKPCMVQWVILLQEFMYKVLVWLRKKHANVNHLSRLKTQFSKTPIDDFFIYYATLFVLEAITMKYVDILIIYHYINFPMAFFLKTLFRKQLHT